MKTDLKFDKYCESLITILFSKLQPVIWKTCYWLQYSLLVCNEEEINEVRPEHREETIEEKWNQENGC